MKNCTLCKNTGFYKGTVCVCIAKPDEDPEIQRILELFDLKEKKP